MLKINPADAVPIWKQIEDEIRRLIVVGTLSPGEPVPSVREVARDLRVNPATVSKAYQRLTENGLLEVKRGEGTYVAESPPPLRRAERRETLSAAALKFVSVAVTIGASHEESVAEVEAAYTRLDGKERRKA